MCKLYEYGLEADKDSRPVLVPIRDLESCKLSDELCIKDFFVANFSLEKKSEEYLYLVGTNSKGEPIGVFECAHGGEASCVFAPSAIFRRLLLCGASAFFVVHNHPSGEASPSEEDLEMAKNLKEGAKVLGLTFLDSLIIAWNRVYDIVRFYSMRTHGLLKDDVPEERKE